jgi:acetate kinase
MRALVVNAGSSTIKLTLLGPGDETLWEQLLEAPKARIDAGEVHSVLANQLDGVDVVGHRIVHGGTRFRAPVVIDDEVIAALRELADLAPLHQPKSLAALELISQALPDVPAVACFDTAFHGTLPAEAYTYALPAAWLERWAIRRYGFHGLSHAWIAQRAAELVGGRGELRIVSCHLGAGASLCAIAGGRSIDTTMGFTPLEGLVMATRSGSMDPGLLLWLLERTGLSEHELAHAVEHESGLLGLTGTADMREILARVGAGDARAELALDVYTHRLRAGIGAMAATLGGLDVLAFTGGIGEHAALVRARAVAGLEFLGVHIDATGNDAAVADAEISAAAGPVRTLVIRAREDIEIARQARRYLRAVGH